MWASAGATHSQLTYACAGADSANACNMYNLNFPERVIQIQFECADLFTQVLMSTEVHKASCRVSHTQCSSTKADTGIHILTDTYCNMDVW